IFTQGAQKMNCERFYYSTVLDQGAIVDVRLKGFSKDLKADFFVMAKEARMNKGIMVAHDVSMSSCSYGVPHYHLTVDQATLLGEEKRPDGQGPWPFNDWTVDFDELVPEFSGLPFFYLPGLTVGPWLMNFPVRGFRYGHSSRYGNYVYSDFGSRIRFQDKDGKLKSWGDVDLKVDWRQVRGEAGGIDLDYKWEG